MDNDSIVLDVVKRSKKHLSAYSILEKFQKIKKVQPMTVYRSLNNLIEKGIIHKSNQNKTYILCNHENEHKHNPSIAICKSCGDTQELKSDLFKNILKKIPLKKYNFTNFELEVSTLCNTCK